MIKKFPLNKRIKQELIQNYPHAMDKINIENIEKVLNTLLSQLPQPEKDIEINEYLRIVANTTVFYLRGLQDLFRGIEESAAALPKDGNGSNDRKDGATPA